jgi:hypothetical protein
MSKTTTQATEKRPTIPGLPSYLVVGTPNRARSSRTKIGIQQLRRMFEWWNSAQPTLKQLSARDVGLPATKLAEEFGLQSPTNGNSFRANVQRILDQLNIEGKTMYLSLRGTDGEKFKVTPETMVWFHPVAVSERSPVHKAK